MIGIYRLTEQFELAFKVAQVPYAAFQELWKCGKAFLCHLAISSTGTGPDWLPDARSRPCTDRFVLNKARWQKGWERVAGGWDRGVGHLRAGGQWPGKQLGLGGQCKSNPNLVAGLSWITWAAHICISETAGVNPSSHVWMPGLWYGVRVKNPLTPSCPPAGIYFALDIAQAIWPSCSAQVTIVP